MEGGSFRLLTVNWLFSSEEQIITNSYTNRHTHTGCLRPCGELEPFPVPACGNLGSVMFRNKTVLAISAVWGVSAVFLGNWRENIGNLTIVQISNEA